MLDTKNRNSIKKAIALAFALFAGMSILAHAVIPHHYHNGIPFMSTAAHHDDAYPDQSYSQEESIEDCFFANVYVILSNDEQLFYSLDFDFDQLPCFLILFSDYSIPKIENNTGFPVGQKPYLLPYPAEYISQSLGLRAPPFFN
jgi:hypothetical protein